MRDSKLASSVTARNTQVRLALTEAFMRHGFQWHAKVAKARTNLKGPKKIWVPKTQITLIADVLNRKAQGFKLVPG